jgi:hypothetical protein
MVNLLRTYGMRLAAAMALFLSGCTALSTQVLVDEQMQPRPAGTTHCAGNSWEDNSMMAIVPLPIIGLGMPTDVLPPPAPPTASVPSPEPRSDRPYQLGFR